MAMVKYQKGKWWKFHVPMGLQGADIMVRSASKKKARLEVLKMINRKRLPHHTTVKRIPQSELNLKEGGKHERED